MLNGSMIIERIDGNNQSAIKYADGTMIVTGKWSSQVNVDKTWGHIYASNPFNPGITFLVPFTEITSYTTSSYYATNFSSWICDVIVDLTSIKQINFLRATSTNSVLGFSYIVIGRWK